MQPSQDQNPLLGIFWMLITGACFVMVTALVKFLGPGIPAAQAAFLRYALGLVFLLPLVPTMLRHWPTHRQLGLLGVRGLVHSFGVMLWFFSMTQIPIAEVTALNYLAPIYVTIGAALFLGERLALRRIAAVVAALVGALIILRPGFRELVPGHISMLVAGVLFGGSYLLTKVLSGQVHPVVVIGTLSVLVTLCLAPFALADWVPVTWSQVGLLFCVAIFATAGHYTMTLAFAVAPLTVTQPVTFLQLVWAVLLGALVFAEPVDAWVVLGAVVILASISFITWREAVLRRTAITPPPEATKL